MRSRILIAIFSTLIFLYPGCSKRGIEPVKGQKNRVHWKGYYEGKSILFDNGTDKAVTVSFPEHGQHISIGAGRWVVLLSGPEKIHMVVDDADGNRLQDISFEYRSQYTYVCNPKAQWDYLVWGREYGGGGDTRVKHPPRGSAFFEIPKFIGNFFEEPPDSVKGIGGAVEFTLEHRDFEPHKNRSHRIERTASTVTYRVTQVNSSNSSEPDAFTIQRSDDPRISATALLVRNPHDHAVTVRFEGIELGQVGPASYTILFVQPGQWHLEAVGPDSDSPEQATVSVDEDGQQSNVPRAWIIGQPPKDLGEEVHWNDELLYF